MRKALERLAEQILSFDEASLAGLLDEYRRKMDSFEPSRDWERSVIIFFIINSVRVKNLMFNENVLKKAATDTPRPVLAEAPREVPEPVPPEAGPTGAAGRKRPRPGTLKLVK